MVRAGMLDEMIKLTAGQTIRQYPKTIREEANRGCRPVCGDQGAALFQRGKRKPLPRIGSKRQCGRRLRLNTGRTTLEVEPEPE
jgi:hypothetical protein